MPDALLDTAGLVTGYGQLPVLQDIDLRIVPGELVGLVGPNGAGKTTLLQAIVGLLPAWHGSVSFAGQDVTRWDARRRARAGISLVAEGRQLFAGLTVRENLTLAATATGNAVEENLERVLALFPELERLLGRVSGTMSGGEQQMCAIGRGLMCRPSLLMIDELSLGLAPVVVDRLVHALSQIHQTMGITIIFVEQDVDLAMDTADRVVLLGMGRVVMDAPAPAVRARRTELEHTFLGLPIDGQTVDVIAEA
ncbi:MAG: ABC transporter ATP-binding protein [Chloroflexi bacterium]|nr:ABC transporter ATP-binding protein [Chloroflexota bacterium]